MNASQRIDAVQGRQTRDRVVFPYTAVGGLRSAVAGGGPDRSKDTVRVSSFLPLSFLYSTVILLSYYRHTVKSSRSGPKTSGSSSVHPKLNRYILMM